MFIEAILERIAIALEDLLVVAKAEIPSNTPVDALPAGAKATAKPVKKKVAAKKNVSATPPAEDTPEGETKPVELDDIRSALKHYLEKNPGPDAAKGARKILTSLGAENLTQLKPADYATALGEIEALGA